MTEAAINSTLSAPVTSQSEARQYLPFLDFFRAFAILCVVMIHAGNAVLLRGIEGAEEPNASAVRTILHIVSHNSTVYFALISGVLYAFTLHRKPHGLFLKSRLANVALPYALVSAGLTVLLALYAYEARGLAIEPQALARLIAYNVIMGEAWNTLWYIPVVMILYFLSPALLALVTNPKWQWLAFVIALLPLFASRTGSEVTPAMVTFYLGVYVVGLFIGADIPRAIAVFQARKLLIWAIAIASALCICALDASNIEYIGPTSIRESAFYLLRLALSALVLLWLHNHWNAFGRRTAGAMLLLANYAFGIYFLHGPLLRPIAMMLGKMIPQSQNWPAVTLAILVAYILALVISTAIVHVIVKLTSPFSSYLIGAVERKPSAAPA